jgi:hypothetical protein
VIVDGDGDMTASQRIPDRSSPSSTAASPIPAAPGPQSTRECSENPSQVDPPGCSAGSHIQLPLEVPPDHHRGIEIQIGYPARSPRSFRIPARDAAPRDRLRMPVSARRNRSPPDTARGSTMPLAPTRPQWITTGYEARRARHADQAGDRPERPASRASDLHPEQPRQYHRDLLAASLGHPWRGTSGWRHEGQA